MTILSDIDLNSFDLMKIRTLTYDQKQQMHRLGDKYLKYFTMDDWLAVYLRYQQKMVETPDERRARIRNAYDLLCKLEENGSYGLAFKARTMKQMLVEYELNGKAPD